MSDPAAVSQATVERVLEGLGFSEAPAMDADGLRALYRAWCRSVPFDNLRKLISLREGSGEPLPGLDSEEFLDQWLCHGTGGTCWPSANALHALLLGCGFDSRLIAASMFDTGDPTHGTTVVTIDGTQWLVDTSMLTDVPLLVASESTRIYDPVHSTTAEPVAEGWLIQFVRADDEATLPCRTMAPTAIDHAFCAERYEISRTWSPFNESVYVRHNDAKGIISYALGERHRRTAYGHERAALTDDALTAALVDEIGFSEEIVARLNRAPSSAG